MNWLEEVEKRKKDLLNAIERLLVIPSIREDSLACKECPVGPGPKKALEEFLEMAKEEGFAVQEIDSIVGQADIGAGESFAILGHVDVVPIGEGWLTDAFVPVYKDEKLYARGALDDKGPLVCAFFAVKLLKDLGYHFKRTVRFIVGTDEESDWNCMKVYRKHFSFPKQGLVPDAYFPAVCGEKGVAHMTVELSAQQSKNKDFVLRKFEAGSKINMVPEQAVAYLSIKDVPSFQKDFQYFLAQEPLIHGTLEIEGNEVVLKVFGVSAHGSAPHKGKNAGTYLAHFLCQYDEFQRVGIISILGNILHEDFQGQRIGISENDEKLGDLTISPGMIYYEQNYGGHISCDIRYPSIVDIQNWKSKVTESLPVDDVSVILQQLHHPHYVSSDSEVMRVLLDVYREQMQLESNPQPLVIGGITYARLLEEGIAFGVLFPDAQDTMHQSNECVKVEDLVRATALYAQALSILVCH